MNDAITKDDLRQFGLVLMADIRAALNETKVNEPKAVNPEWLKSRVVRKLLDISPGTLQNLRITGQVRYEKILGSYYYNKSDLERLFQK